MTEPWWRQAVIYQVYLRSFADSDGDGVGDLEGLRGRLDYLRRLGVDGIWLNPCYPSPGADHGYDVSDYMDIDPAGGTWTLANHDVHRSVSRYGLLTRTGGPSTRPRGEVDVALGVRRARAAALLTLALPGSVYLYQGEEAGLPEVLDLPDSVRQDPTFLRSGPSDYGRDGCRVPLPWTSTGPSFGFSASPSPWLPQPRWFSDYAIEDQIDAPDSTWTLHHQALTLRRTLAGPLEWLPTPRPDVLAFRRGPLTSVTVFGDTPYPTTLGTPALASTPCTPDEIPGNTTAWFVE